MRNQLPKKIQFTNAKGQVITLRQKQYLRRKPRRGYTA